jgi:hypothetical protein
MTNQLTVMNNEAGLARLAAVAAQAQQVQMLKFVKGKWLVKDDEVPAGREFIVYADQTAQGWVKFI